MERIVSQNGRVRVPDFEKPAPASDIEDGIDAFDERGRYLLFVEMIGAAATDLTLPAQHADHQDAMEWLSDPSYMRTWLMLIGGDIDLAEKLQTAIKGNPTEIGSACSKFLSVSHGDTFTMDKFLRAFGIATQTSGSSLVDFEDSDSLDIPL